MAELKIKQTRSAIGRRPAQRRTLRALGLGKIGRTVVRTDSPDLRGMIATVRHLIEVIENGERAS